MLASAATSAQDGVEESTTRHVFALLLVASADGGLIAFTRGTYRPSSIEPQRAVYTVAPSGGGGERLLIEDAAEARWSPDGSRIAFTSYRDRNGRTCFQECSRNGEISVADADGTDLRRLTTNEADDHSPTWSPDGRRITFVSDRSTPSITRTRSGSSKRTATGCAG